jgi:hypothetical protein
MKVPPDLRAIRRGSCISAVRRLPTWIYAGGRCRGETGARPLAHGGSGSGAAGGRVSDRGLYDGVPLTEKSVSDQPQQPDAIWLFRRPILDEWADRGNVTLAELVSHVMVHELAHHFGWSDDDIARIDPWWE